MAGLSVISRELANDSNPAAAETVGLGLARDMARKIDDAFFGSLPAPAAPGLATVTGVQTVNAGATWTNTDPFVNAIALAETVGATITGFAANPADSLAMSLIKKATGSNEPLLGNDSTSPTRRTIGGIPLFISPSIESGTVWALPADRVLTIVRENVDLQADSSVFFTSDRVAVRATARIGFGFPHPQAIVKVTLT